MSPRRFKFQARSGIRTYDPRFDPTLSDAQVQALLRDREIPDPIEDSHTPEGWLPRNQRPEYVHDVERYRLT